MRVFFFTFFISGFLFQANAQKDTIGMPALKCNPACLTYDSSIFSPRKYLIDAHAYENIQAWSPCYADSFPSVDFNKYILLHLSYSYSGCERNVDKKMTYQFDHINKKLILYLTVFEKGVCRPMYHKRDLFPIPIVPESYSIEIYRPGTKKPLIIAAE